MCMELYRVHVCVSVVYVYMCMYLCDVCVECMYMFVWGV